MGREPREIMLRFEGGLADGWQLAQPEPAPDSYSWATFERELVADRASPKLRGKLENGELGSITYYRADDGPDVFLYLEQT